MRIDQQQHGYLSGHQLLSSSVRLDGRDQETVDRLSDLVGTLGPGERCPTYLTGYPLPSRRYYVLARTWYDEAAHRSGCVLTHSLLIPLGMWETLPQPAALLGSLCLVNKRRDRRTIEPLECAVDAIDMHLARVRTPERHQLIEAFFLEQRRPIVWFDPPDAETIALRLVQALWPAMRRCIAFCTFALQPRTVEGRDFDLLLAPKHARSRYADWKGRRIERSFDTHHPRHRWSEELATFIFEADVPHLSVDDSLGILSRDSQGDPGALRLVFLWHELFQRAQESPNAVLGLLDILASIGLSRTEVTRRSEPLITAAAVRIGRTMDASEGFRFLDLLVGKFSQLKPGRSALTAIRRSACELASKDVVASVTAIALHRRPTLGVRAIQRGVADALAQLQHSPSLFDALASGPENAVAELFALSPGLCAAAVLHWPDYGRSEWPEQMAAIVTRAEPVLRRRLRRNMLPAIRHSHHAALLAALLSGIRAEEITWTVRTLWQSSGLMDRRLAEALTGTVLPNHAMELRSALVNIPDSSSGLDAVIARTFHPPDEALRWLLSEPHLAVDRRSRLLLRFLAVIDDNILKKLEAGNRSLLGAAVAWLSDVETSEAAHQVGRLLPLTEFDAGYVLAVMHHVVPLLGEDKAGLLITSILPRLIGDPDAVDRPSLIEFLHFPVAAQAARRMGAGRLLDCFVPTGASAFNEQQQSNVLVLLLHSSSQFRKSLSEHIDELVHRLASRRGRLDAMGFAAWALILGEAIDDGKAAAVRAAAISLRFAFGHPKLATNPLVFVAFPVVYGAVSSSGYVYDVNGFFSFFDWDRAKTLRVQLIECFLSSVWPPGDLMLTAEESGIGRRILKRITRESHSGVYVERMKVDLQARPGELARRALERILEFERDPPSGYEWD